MTSVQRKLMTKKKENSERTEKFKNFEILMSYPIMSCRFKRITNFQSNSNVAGQIKIPKEAKMTNEKKVCKTR